MKTQRLIDILLKANTQFPNCEITIEDGYIAIELKDTPTQDQIDMVPKAEYDEYSPSKKISYKTLRIWSN